MPKDKKNISEVNTWNVRCYSQFGNGHPNDHYVGFKQEADQLLVWAGLTETYPHQKSFDLRGQFPGKLISKRVGWPRPPCLPDLAICAFFLWCHLKQAVKPATKDIG